MIKFNICIVFKYIEVDLYRQVNQLFVYIDCFIEVMYFIFLFLFLCRIFLSIEISVLDIYQKQIMLFIFIGNEINDIYKFSVIKIYQVIYYLGY